MIESFKHKGLKNLYKRGSKRGINPNWVEKVERMLARLDVSGRPEDMNIHGWGLHELSGDRRGDWAVWVTRNQRLTFRFVDGSPCSVDIEDYHGN